MKHARADYDRIQDPAGKIPEDEPVFLLRAQDALAAEVVKFYAWRCRNAGIHDIADMVEGHAKLMEQWYPKKMPDLPSPQVTEQPHD